MTDPFINILIRVSKNRETVLSRCLASIAEQTFTNYQIVFSYDDDSCADYLTAFWPRIKVDPDQSLGPFFYNDYCNALKSEVNTGWFFFLDSDDYLENEYSLKNIAKDMRGDAWQAVVCQMRRDSGKVKPNDELISAKRIESGRVGLPCLFLRAQYKDSLKIGAEENADFVWIKTITESVATKFVKKVVVCSPKRSFGL